MTKTATAKRTKAEPEAKPQPSYQLSDADMDLFYSILDTQSDSGQTDRMQATCTRLAHSFGAVVETDPSGNLYLTKGTAEVYPCFVAHTDTVHPIVPDQEYTVYRDPMTGMLWSPTGIGGDDKCGVFIALALLRDLPACKVFLPVDEEIGCMGADAADLSFFDDCAFAVECDRKGKADAVRDAGGTELYGDALAAALDPILDTFGFSVVYGMMTDVMTLKERGLAIAAMNLSAGYYSPHSKAETIDPNDVARTLELCRSIAEQLSYQQWQHTAPRQAYEQYTTFKPYSYTKPDPKRPCRLCEQPTNVGWCETCHAYTQPADEPATDACLSCGESVGLFQWCEACQRYTDEPQDAPTDDYQKCTLCGGIDTQYDPAESGLYCWTCERYCPDPDEPDDKSRELPDPIYEIANASGEVIAVAWTEAYAIGIAERYSAPGARVVDMDTGEVIYTH